jgi:hypothetical protein
MLIGYMISVVDRNDREELTSVYEVGLYAILYRKLVQCQERQQSTRLCFQEFFQCCQWYDAPGICRIIFSEIKLMRWH